MGCSGPDTVDVLLNNNATWSKDEKRRSPLWWAASGGHKVIVEKLIKRFGSREEIWSELVQGGPIDCAYQNGHLELCALLIERAIDHLHLLGYYDPKPLKVSH